MLSWALALASAALLILTFPGASIVWFAPVALTPLLVAVAREDRWRQRFLLGWSAGVVYWFGVCYWIRTVLADHAGVSGIVAWLLFLLFCVAKAMHLGVFALLAGPLMRRWWAVPSVAALWVAIEVTHGSLGFAWLALGNAGIDMALPMRLAPLTGVYGLSFLFMMMAASVALVCLRRSRIELLWLAPVLALPLFPPLPNGERGREFALLVQPNLSETEDWTTQKIEETKRGLVTLSLRGSLVESPPPSLIVWPEAPAPFYYFDDPQFRSYIDSLARATRASVLVGIVARVPGGGPLNSAVLVSPEGVPMSRYDKVNLVPFGEFVPWPFNLVANKVSTEVGDYVAGKRVVVSPIGAHQLGTFICYESVFPNFVRRFVNGGAEVLVNISNDGWFAKSYARDQHFAMVRMRAAENRRWLLRATNDGITATVDPAGRIARAIPSYYQATAYTGFRYVAERTFYTRYGDWFPLLCAIWTVMGLVAARIM
ncbi:MAG TPA: apolipoprotein N-acyltransferase [Candidatus Solibacter sp.]|nr:apolipoprotein N-acyltransferase [Candidatus Solibacter sp.]